MMNPTDDQHALQHVLRSGQAQLLMAKQQLTRKAPTAIHTLTLPPACSRYVVTHPGHSSDSSDRGVKLARAVPFAFHCDREFDQRLHSQVKQLAQQEHTDALLAALVKGSGPLLVQAHRPGGGAGTAGAGAADAGAAAGAATSPGGSGSSTTAAGLSTQQQREALQQQLRREVIQLAYSEIFALPSLPQRYGAALDLAMQGPGKALDVWVLLQLLACRLGMRVVVLVQQPAKKRGSGGTEVVAVQVLPVAKGGRYNAAVWRARHTGFAWQWHCQ